MPLYSVRLDDPTSDHFRVRTLEAADVDAATARAELLEANRVAFSLTEQRPVRAIETRRHADGVHATINVSPFADSGLAGHDLLHYCEREHSVDGDGKAHGPNKHIKQRLTAHYQLEPYEVSAVGLVVPSASEFVRMARALTEHDGKWEEVLAAMRDAGIPTAAVTGSLYGLTAQKMIDGSVALVWSSDTWQVALTTSSYTPNQDTDDFRNDFTANEVTGTGYTAGGVVLGTKTSTYDTATDQIRLDAADSSWATSTITARRAPLFRNTAGADSTDEVLGWLDFGADVSTTAGTFTIAWDATGIVVYDVT